MSQHYRSTDLYFAAYVHALGIPLLRMDQEGRRFVFVFDLVNAPAAEQLKEQYFSGKGEIVPLVYANSVKTLKTLMHSRTS